MPRTIFFEHLLRSRQLIWVPDGCSLHVIAELGCRQCSSGKWVRADTLDSEKEQISTSMTNVRRSAETRRETGERMTADRTVDEAIRIIEAIVEQDEAAARGAFSQGSWDNASDEGNRICCGILMVGHAGRSDAAHIVRWDPKRVLQECRTKRAMITEYRKWFVQSYSPIKGKKLVEARALARVLGEDLIDLSYAMEDGVARVEMAEGVKIWAGDQKIKAAPPVKRDDHRVVWATEPSSAQCACGVTTRGRNAMGLLQDHLAKHAPSVRQTVINPEPEPVTVSWAKMRVNLSGHVSATAPGRSYCSCGFRADGHEAEKMLDQHLQDQLEASFPFADEPIKHQSQWASSTTSAAAVCSCGWSMTRTWARADSASAFRDAMSIVVDEHRRTHDQP